MCKEILLSQYYYAYTWQYTYSAWYDVGISNLHHTVQNRCTALHKEILLYQHHYFYTWQDKVSVTYIIPCAAIVISRVEIYECINIRMVTHGSTSSPHDMI